MRNLKIVPVFLFLSLLFFSSDKHPQSATQNKIYRIPIRGEINFGLAEFLERGLRQAQEEEAKLVILDIDTLGGRVDACLEMVQHIQTVTSIPVYAYVESKSWSAGALISFACEKIIMKSGSSIGSAAPVTGAGKDLGEKYVSALRSKFQAVAEVNGYPVNIAAAMVDKSLEVKQIKINDKIRYLTRDQIIGLEEKSENFRVTNIVSEEGKLLNLTYSQAKKYNIASDIVSGFEAIPKLYGLEAAGLVELEKNWAEYLAIFFTNAMVTSLLLTIGLIFIYMELAEPGLGWPALISLICFGLFFFGRYVVNLAEWADIILFAVGFLLIIIEIFVVPGFGVPGVLGGLLVLISFYLALSPYKIPQSPWDFHTFQTTLLVLLGSLTASIAGGFALLSNLHRIPFLNKIVLDKTMESNQKEDSLVKKKRKKIQIGDKGETVTDLRPVGRVAFGDFIYDAISQHGYIQKEEKVVVIEISNNRILVKKEV